MKDTEFWDEDAILKDALFETNLSIAAIGEKVGWSRAKTAQRIKQLGLEWVRRNNRKLSRGHAALTDIMQKLLPGEVIINEHHIGERLMLDIYCENYKLAAEYHGRQHFFYSNLFHKSKQDFIDQQNRDIRKEELCKEKGIGLVVFRFNDDLDDDAVYDRMIEAIRNTPYGDEEETKKKPTFKGNHFYEKMQAKQREYRKQKYREYKNNRNSK